MYRINKVPLKEAKPGMEIGKMVLTSDKKVIISEGTILNDIIIEGLIAWGIRDVFIREQIFNDDVEFKHDFSVNETENQRQFYEEYEKTIDVVKSTFCSIRYFKELPLDQMKELAGQAIEKMISRVGVINHIYMMRRQDDYTFHHSINVAIICGILGKWMGITGIKLKELVLAGLLHDVGKMRIPLEILNKPGQLTLDEFEIMKQHTTHGYQMLQQSQTISREVSFGILQHHEKMDGSGYPLGVDGSRINEFAKIMAVADVYDAMTSDRVYRGGVVPFVVVEMMVKEMFGKLDPMACSTFLNNVKDYLVGNVVILSDGREAEVIHMGHYLASRPVVFADNGEIIDLEVRKDISIVEAKGK